MSRELERVNLAEFLLERWMASMPQDYTDFMVTPEVQEVLDIGEAINHGRLQVAPVASHASVIRWAEPFVFTPEVIEIRNRLEASLEKLRQRKKQLVQA